MFRNKKDVDKHVENLSKLSVKEFKARAYSVARLYFEVGDYTSCQKYAEQYISQKNNNAAAYKLLGQALQKLEQKEKALEQFKISLDLDPTQTSTVLEICELLTDNEVAVEPGHVQHWCSKAEAIFPRHPITFRLREKLMLLTDPNPEGLVNLLLTELATSPKDVSLNGRLLKHYLSTNQIKEAVNHSCNVEFGGVNFRNNYAWYETLAEIVKHCSNNLGDWQYQLLLLTVRERLCVLSLTDTISASKSILEANELLFLYDQDIENVAKAGPTSGNADFHANLLNHHRGQLVFHAATYLLKKAKKDQLSWNDATQFAAPLMLMAWHTSPVNTTSNWILNVPEKQQQAVKRWHTEATYRCSQSGHYLMTNSQEKSQSYIDKISQCCSGTHWRYKIFERIFNSKLHLSKVKTSHFVTTNAFSVPILRLPRKNEVEALDNYAQIEYPNSLHHYVWMILNYKNFAHFNCNSYDSLWPRSSMSGPESLNKLDVYAFIYCTALTSKQQKCKEFSYISSDKPAILPANITNLLCTVNQMKWWDCAYKFSQNELGSELTDIRSTLTRGIEVVRCVDHYGLDPELLCVLGRIFCEKARLTSAIEEKNNFEKRAALYYASAIPLLEKLKMKVIIKLPDKRLFDYTHKELETKDLNVIIEESKLFVGINLINDGDYEKAIETLSDLKSPEAIYHLAQSYKKVAQEKNTDKEKYVTLLSKAKTLANYAIDSLKYGDINKTSTLYEDTQKLIEELDKLINKVDLNPTFSVINDIEEKYTSDENVSFVGGEPIPLINQHILRSVSSTPKASPRSPGTANNTNYHTVVDSQILENSRLDYRRLERIETEIIHLQKRDNTISDFMEQSKEWFKENKKLGTEIISTIHTNIQNTTDQFKLLKLSVDQVKGQIDECRNECKDVGELKKQITEIKKDISKLKKTSSNQTMNENDVFNLNDEYKTNETTPNFNPQLPFTPQMLSQFNQRLIPPFPVHPNPFQFYGQNLFNLFNQYSQFGQSSQIPPGAPSLFDPVRAPMNYPGVYPTPESMYLDVSQLVPPTNTPSVSVPAAPVAPSFTKATSVPPIITVPSGSSFNISKPVHKAEIPQTLPVNVVITSSDPLPTCTTSPAPVLSVTIPSKHIKNSPHNYQISMPHTNNDTEKSSSGYGFTFQNGSSTINWNQTSSMSEMQQSNTNTDSSYSSTLNSINAAEDTANSNSVVDGVSRNTPNTSLNKSRTLSEKSNTSVDYDPCPDFKPIIPLPDEVKVTTGEEDETIIFNSRAKLFRFVDKQWKERGLGEMKLLKHNITGKVRVLMRREQIHKICANHNITPEMEITPMQNENKAYFWFANDFAEEKLVFEKFCIRFKTADIAQQFFEKFEQARKDSTTICSSTPNVKEKKIDSSVSVLANYLQTPVKTTENSNSGIKVGGFTFSSTPTFKPVSEELKADPKSSETTETAPYKVNVFSTFNFKSHNMNSPFSNIFGTSEVKSDDHISSENKDSTNKLNSSDIVEEYEPNVEFKPVIPLPALVDLKTGEEDETILFEHRAKLLRYDSNTKEWKERGLGNIKILVNKNNVQQVRLLMRRDQIKKVCCNHNLTKDMVFKKMPNMDKAITWCAKDYSDEELVSETFCLRFKTVEICDTFEQSIISAISKMNEVTDVKVENNPPKPVIGFGDQFKPKPGAWCCEACYTNNLENYDYCACCEQPKPQPQKGKAEVTSPFSTPSIASNWGDLFKSKPGTWECKECLIRNEPTLDRCSACSNPKSPGAVKTSCETSVKFKFGIPTQSSNNSLETKETSSGCGDKFKPKEGSWECQQCFVRNEPDVKNCNACQNPKNLAAASKEPKSILGAGSSAPKYSFGIPASSSNQSSIQTSSIFDGTGVHKFSFGIPTSTQVGSVNIVTFGNDNKLPSNVIIAPPKASSDNQAPINLSLNKESENIIETEPVFNETNYKTSNEKEGKGFDFVFKPKSPTKNKSPVKSLNEEDSDDYASDDEGHHIHFTPIIPLPDKVEVITGEENEVELYGHKAKLYRYSSDNWKERGVGIVKLLKHKKTGKLRVVMRREQVLKICLNHALTADITYTPKDEKTWLFAANDFSEGELNLSRFCLRFKNEAVANEFKEAVDKARRDISFTVTNSTTSNEKDNEEVEFIGEIVATTEEKQRAKELMLPENFYTYKIKTPCQGCRGCDSEDHKNIFGPVVPKASGPQLNSTVSTPNKNSIQSFNSPANSLYGTPANIEKAVDTSIFRTPLGSVGSKPEFATPMFGSSNISKYDNPSKENNATIKSNIFGIHNEQKSLFSTPKLSGFGLVGESIKKNDVKPVIENVNSSKPNFVFGNTNTGTSLNKSIFGLSTDNKTPDNTVVSSVFSGVDQKPINFFSGSGQNSLFGPGSLSNQSKPDGSIFGKTFGVNSNQSQIFSLESQNQLAKSESKQSENSNLKSTWPSTKPDITEIKAQTLDLAKINDDIKNEPILKMDGALSFTALSNSGVGFVQKKNEDFKWEGAGQQLFKREQKSSNDADTSHNDSGNADGDEYDPHYEPIVPLPDKIVVTTGEEDEEKLFAERSKLYRYDDKTKEWKERGVGEIKILHHPDRNTYRLLLRREQVYKAVLNTLLHIDFELLPIKNSPRAYTWACRNFAENAAGETETLCARFQNVQTADKFQHKVVECVRLLQAAAARAVEKKDNIFSGVTPLRLPKHLQDSARADNAMSAKAEEHAQAGRIIPINTQTKPNGKEATDAEKEKQTDAQSSDSVEEDSDKEDEDDYEHDYDNDDYDAYYNDEESAAFYSCEGRVVVKQGPARITCDVAQIQVMYDQGCHSPKIFVTDASTGEVLVDMLIHTDTEFQQNDLSCSWSGMDFTSNVPIDKTVIVTFQDSDTAMQFYDSCETTKAATYASTDHES